MRGFPVRFAVGALLACAAVPHTLAAQGYGVYQQGACTMARSGAAVASPCADGSAMYFNPAGIAPTGDESADAPRGLVSLGGTLIAPRGSFTDALTGRMSETEENVYAVPNVYATYRVSDRATAGIGLFAPYGLTTQWPEQTSQGRFLSYYTRSAGIYVQPTAAYRVNDWLSVGAGLDISFVSVALRQHVDLSSQRTTTPGVTFANLGVPAGTDFADIRLEGSSNSVGYHVGAIVKPLDKVSVGARYMSRQLIEFDDGEATIRQLETGLVLAPGNPLGLPAGTRVDDLVAPQFGPGGPLTNQRGSTFLRFPEQFVLGVAVQPTERAKLLVDWQYTNWEVFEVLQIEFENLGTRTIREDFRGVSTFRFGGEYMVSPATTLRLGYYTHNAAAPAQTVTPSLPEGPRASFSAGLGTRLGNRFTIDLAYQYIDQADRQGRTGDGGLAVPTTAQNNGLYEFHANLFGATFAYAF